MITPDEYFNEVKDCDYKGEHYSVRDNGAIMRHPRSNKARPKDNIWTFGEQDEKTGYMLFCGARVHIIVATAFYEAHDSKIFVVDHIDTNRCNNRIENLRWLTRLENALNNPVTRKRIEYLCGGDIQKFINDPSCLRDLTGTNQDLSWMRTVNAEEAKIAYERVMSWAILSSNQTPSTGGKLGEWIYQPKKMYYNVWEKPIGEEHVKNAPPITAQEEKYSVTSNKLAVYIGWTSNPEFPCCPIDISDNPLQDYLNNLKIGKIFVKTYYGESLVHEYTIYNDKLLVITKIIDGIKNFALTEVTWDGDVFIHRSRRTFFEENGARAAYVEAQDQEWIGPDSIDFYC